MTAEEFERAYAERSGVSVEWLRAHGRTVRPCRCDEDGCEGWQSISFELASDPMILRQAAGLHVDYWREPKRPRLRRLRALLRALGRRKDYDRA